MTVRLGIIGLSSGNGHPYSWSAIFNGYDSAAMANCGFPVIPEYLSRQNWPADSLKTAKVTHIWTQSISLSNKIAKTCHIENVVKNPSEMLGNVDAILLARDDAQNHIKFAKPFLSAGLPIYIDKPVALTQREFEYLHKNEQYDGQIFSCSALRFAPELQISKDQKESLGRILFVKGTIAKSWDKYAIHLIDPILNILGPQPNPKKLFCEKVGVDGRILGVRLEGTPSDIHLITTGSIDARMEIHLFGEDNNLCLSFHDSFTAFRNTLDRFIKSISDKGYKLPVEFNRCAVEIIEMGRL